MLQHRFGSCHGAYRDFLGFSRSMVLVEQCLAVPVELVDLEHWGEHGSVLDGSSLGDYLSLGFCTMD